MRPKSNPKNPKRSPFASAFTSPSTRSIISPGVCALWKDRSSLRQCSARSARKRLVAVQPTISPAQVAIAKGKADSVHDALAHGGGAPFDSLARAYADPNEPKLADALPVSQLPPDYVKAIGSDSIPGLKPVFEVGAGTARPRFVVFELTKRLPEGELSFDEVKDRIRDGLSQQLAIKHHLDVLRRTTYVSVRF